MSLIYLSANLSLILNGNYIEKLMFDILKHPFCQKKKDVMNHVDFINSIREKKVTARVEPTQ